MSAHRPAHTERPLPAARQAAFTLIELLVATAVLTILLLIVMGIVNNTAALTSNANRKVSADSEGRQMLDRIGADLRRIILREDLPQMIGKVAGNDSITFYSQMDGYSGDRGISRISYGILDGKMHRGAKGTFWDGTGDDAVSFEEETLPSVSDMESGIMSGEIFRFEIAFFLRDGSIEDATPSLLNEDKTKDVRAIIITVAVLDSRSRKLLPGPLSDLAALFPDAQDGVEVGKAWNDVLLSPAFNSNPAYPQPVRAAIRIYQRFCFLEP